jgi:hypothetical protein
MSQVSQVRVASGHFLALIFALFSSLALAGDLPPKGVTGVTDPSLTKARICAKGFSTKTVRSVTEETKAAVYKRDHMDPKRKPCPCEVDHLKPLELGGANNVKNLWVQSYQGPWNAHDKDRLENRLHKLMCAGKVDQTVALRDIATDWKAAYKRYMPSTRKK